MTEQDAILALSAEVLILDRVRAALAVFGITGGALELMVIATMFRSALDGDTGAAKMWLINRAGDEWSTRSRRPKADVLPAEPAAEPDPGSDAKTRLAQIRLHVG